MFQSLGAAIEKARLPYVEVADLGTVSKPFLMGIRARENRRVERAGEGAMPTFPFPACTQIVPLAKFTCALFTG